MWICTSKSLCTCICISTCLSFWKRGSFASVFHKCICKYKCVCVCVPVLATCTCMCVCGPVHVTCTCMCVCSFARRPHVNVCVCMWNWICNWICDCKYLHANEYYMNIKKFNVMPTQYEAHLEMHVHVCMCECTRLSCFLRHMSNSPRRSRGRKLKKKSARTGRCKGGVSFRRH